jgi:hypothetical protein
VKDWMRRLAAHYGRSRAEYPEDRLLVVFDIDGTILDMRHMVRRVLLSFDRAHGSDWFHGLEVGDIDVHENQADRWLAGRGLPDGVSDQVLRFYNEQRWLPEAVLAAHRPYQGVLDVIRWFQLQPATHVGLNTGRPEQLRRETLRSLNALGEEYRVEFRDELLHMNPHGWEKGVASAKVAGVQAFQAAGYRVFAAVDNEPGNIRAMADADETGEILFLHAETLYESKRVRTPRTTRGRSYDITALVAERDLPQHVQLVWHGVNDEWNLRHFLASPVGWGECDVRLDPLGRVVLRHDSFEESPWSSTEPVMGLEQALGAFGERDRGIKLDLKQGGDLLERVLGIVGDQGVDGTRLWFNGRIDSLHEEGFLRLATGCPDAIVQCPVDFLAPVVVSAPARARDLLEMLREWGVNRFSVSWESEHRRLLFDRLDRWGYDVNIYAVPDLEAFLQAALLLPRSLTADFNFPQWHYFGRGSGERGAHHRYRVA